MVFGFIEDLFGGGGGDAAAYSVSTTLQGGETPVGLVSTVQGGDTPLGVVSTIQGGTEAVELDVGLDDVNVDVGGTERPLHGIAEVRLPQPLRTETDLDSHVNVEPVQVDVCLDVGLSHLPRARIDQPWTGRFGLKVLGLELLGYEWSGRSSTVMDDLETRPYVELGDGGPGRQHRHRDRREHGRAHGHRGHGRGPKRPPDGGVHVHVG